MGLRESPYDFSYNNILAAAREKICPLKHTFDYFPEALQEGRTGGSRHGFIPSLQVAPALLQQLRVREQPDALARDLRNKSGSR